MKHKLSFCTINMLSEAVAEVIVNSDHEISIEMVEELAKDEARIDLSKNGIYADLTEYSQLEDQIQKDKAKWYEMRNKWIASDHFNF